MCLQRLANQWKQITGEYISHWSRHFGSIPWSRKSELVSRASLDRGYFLVTMGIRLGWEANRSDGLRRVYSLTNALYILTACPLFELVWISIINMNYMLLIKHQQQNNKHTNRMQTQDNSTAIQLYPSDNNDQVPLSKKCTLNKYLTRCSIGVHIIADMDIYSFNTSLVVFVARWIMCWTYQKAPWYLENRNVDVAYPNEPQRFLQALECRLGDPNSGACLYSFWPSDIDLGQHWFR